jgi:hypothetical protein
MDPYSDLALSKSPRKLKSRAPSESKESSSMEYGN